MPRRTLEPIRAWWTQGRSTNLNPDSNSRLSVTWLSVNMIKAELIPTLMLLFLCYEGIYSCDPAEEGTPYTLEYTVTKFPADIKMLMWMKDDMLMAECPVDSTVACVTNDISWFAASVTKQIDDSVKFAVHIPNPSRQTLSDAKGQWKLKTHTSDPKVQVFYNCHLQIYAKPKNVECETQLSKDGDFIVSCAGSQVYPEAMLMVHRPDLQSFALSCSNKRTLEDPLYYSAKCNVKLEKRKLHLHIDDFIFNMYPSVIGFQNVHLLGVNVSASVNIEPSTMVVKVCKLKQDTINCSCTRLDSTKGGSVVRLYRNNTLLDSRAADYVGNINDSNTEITCKIDGSENVQTESCKESGAVIVLLIFLIIAIVVISVLCILYVKFCTSVKEILKRTFCKKANQETTVNLEASNENESNQQLLEEKKEIEPEPTTSNKEQSLLLNRIEDEENRCKIKREVLLVGTKGCKKELFKAAILKQQDKNDGVDSKEGDKMKQNEDDKCNIHFYQLNDGVIKIVDGPIFHRKNTHKFIEDIKSCLALSYTGYNSIIIVFSKERSEDVISLIEILHEGFDIDMNCFIFVDTNEETKKEKQSKSYKQIEDLCRRTIVKTNKHDADNGDFFSKLDPMEKNFTKHLLNISTLREKQYKDNQEILKEIALFMNVVLGGTLEAQSDIGFRLDRLDTFWKKYKEKVINYDETTAERVDKTEGRNSKKQDELEYLMTDVKACEDINYIIGCFRQVYFVAQPIEKNKRILLNHVAESFEKLRIFYLKSMIETKIDCFDSNVIHRLSVRKTTKN